MLPVYSSPQAAPDAPGPSVGDRQTQDHFRRAVESRLEIRRDLVVPVEHRAAEIAYLDDVVRLVHQNVVDDVGVHGAPAQF